MTTLRELRYKQVDVFSRRIASGNPVAIILCDSAMTDAEMLRLANWINLSETVFVTEIMDSASYSVRIFTPLGELPFAGHPTLGCAHALLEWGLLDKSLGQYRQHCGAGEIIISVKNDATRQDYLSLVSPPFSHREIEESSMRLLKECLPDIEVTHEALVIDVGPRWLVTRLDHYQLHLYRPQVQTIMQLSHQENLTGVTLFALTDSGNSVYTRSFAPSAGVTEDPVCGSGNISVTAYLASTRQIYELSNPYTAYQGHELGRNGVVYLHYIENKHEIHLGGNCITAIDGKFHC